MKVTITHSIDLEDLPEKVVELLMPAEDKLSNSIRWLSTLCRDYSNEDISAAVAAENLDRIRKALSDCDSVLSEVSDIVQGIVAHEQQQQLPPSSPPAPEQRTLSEEDQALADDMLRGLKEKQDEPNLPF